MNMVDNMKAGLTSASNEVTELLKFVINMIGVPLMCIVIAGIMSFFIVGAVKNHRNGEDYGDQIIKIVVCIVAICAIGSFPVWGWTMLGVAAI